MKKYLLLNLLTFSTMFNVAAQGNDFAPVGAKWYYKQSSFNFPYPEEFRLVEVTGEAMFQGQLCRVIEGMTGCGLLNPSYVFTRNDSTFFWSQFTTNFELLYDFGASVGNTWLIKGLGLTGDSLRIFIDSIGQRIINTDTLKTWHISYLGCYDWGNEIMEKVGNFRFLSPSFCLCENNPFGVRCYLDQSSYYHFVPYPCDTSILLVGTNSLDLSNRIQCTPNPFQETITLTTEPFSEPFTFLLFDNVGKLVIRQKFSGSAAIETTSLPNGVYFWAVEMSGTMARRGKCVKH